MQPLAEPIPPEILESELTPQRFIRDANNGRNKIFIISWQNAPNVLRETGRLRELAFRTAGGGTGKEVDIDDYDTADAPYRQLIVWNPDEREIVGGYRFIKCQDAPRYDGRVQLATAELFDLSDEFMTTYLPYTMELGRSFVQPKYQPSAGNRKGLFSLDNLWDGLGAIVVDNPDIRYFFGKVTMYPEYNRLARDMILFFMNYFFPDPDRLVRPFHPLSIENDMHEFERKIRDKPYKEAHGILNRLVRDLGENIPPLVNSYMNLSATMKTFGTALNTHFGDVEETGILVTIADIYETKKHRHLQSYRRQAG